MKKKLQLIIPTLAALVLLPVVSFAQPILERESSGAAGIIYGQSQPWAPPPGQKAQFKYQFFPEPQVYYEPMRELFFYRMDGEWIKSPVLPRNIRDRLGGFVIVEMDAADPHIHHAQVMEYYAPSGGTGPPPAVAPEKAAEEAREVPVRGYRYHYYPRPSVYFDPDRNLFFFRSEGQWRESSILPPYLEHELGDFVVVDLYTPKPYLYHSYVEEIPTQERPPAGPTESAPWQPTASGPA
jgi:hypothetical protein